MRRREFIGLIGGAVAAWPFKGHAQQAMPVIGFLSGVKREEYAITAFRRGLSEAGYVEGQNVSVEHRYADGNYERLPSLAAELNSLPVNLIVAVPSSPVAMAAKGATSTIPIVFFIGLDPVALGLVASYNRPGANITGIALPIANEMTAKRIELLHSLLPKLVPIAVLVNPSNPAAGQELKTTQEAVKSLGREFIPVQASTKAEIESAFEAIVRRKAALVVVQEAYLTSERALLVSLAEHHAIPSIYGPRLFTDIGGLMSYGPNTIEMYRLVGVYVGKILHGALPADLPVLQPSKYELVINLKTAKALGLTVPDKLIALADEVIE